MKNKLKEELWQVGGLFLVWRVVTWLFALISKNRLNLGKDTAYEWIADQPWIPNLHPLGQIWVRWDSGWYLTILERGYYFEGLNNWSNVVFFPLYPLLVKITGLELWGGIILSTIFSFLACLILYRLSNSKTVFYLLIFPAALFLVSVYTESLYLFLVLLCFYLAKKKRWREAGIAAALLSATRPNGILMLPVLIFEYLEQNNFKFKKIKKDILWLLLSLAGIGSYMIYLHFKFGNFLLFLQAQTIWRQKMGGNIFVTLGSYLHDLFLGGFSAYALANSFDFICFILFLVLSFFVFFKVRKSYGVFMWLNLLIPLFTNTLWSMTRFVLVLFPAYILLAKWGQKYKWVDSLITITFLLFSALFIIMFANSYWVG